MNMKMMLQDGLEALQRGRRFIVHDIWRIGLPGEEIPHGIIIKQIRVIILLVRGLGEETLLLRAAALTFATILFIVPFLAFTFFFIQTFDLGDQFYARMSDRIQESLTWVAEHVRTEDDHTEERGNSAAPAIRGETPGVTHGGKPGESAGETPGGPDGETSAPGDVAAVAPDKPPRPSNQLLQQQLINALFPIFAPGKSLSDAALGQNPVQFLVGLAEQGTKNPKAITITGILFVLSTVFGFMRNVEWSFNRIWGVRRTRSIFRAISDYMMITLLLPFAAAFVLALTATLESEFAVNMLGDFSMALRGGQFLVICLTFSLLYFFVPNTRVQVRYALLGGLVAGGLWVVSSWAYMRFQFGLLNYMPFFSGFALFPLLLMWVYVSWVILLFGALLTFAYQNENTFAMERLARDASFAYREALAIRVTIEMARRFHEGLPGLTVTAAAHAWHVPTRLLLDTMNCLTARGLAVECATDPVTYVPGRSPETTRVIDVLRAMREEGQEPSALRQEGEYRPLFQGVTTGDSQCLQSTLAEIAIHAPAKEPEPEC